MRYFDLDGTECTPTRGYELLDGANETSLARTQLRRDDGQVVCVMTDFLVFTIGSEEHPDLWATTIVGDVPELDGHVEGFKSSADAMFNHGIAVGTFIKHHWKIFEHYVKD